MSEYDTQVALWISRMSLHLPVIAKQMHAGADSEDIRQIVRIGPVEGEIPRAALRPLLAAREAQFEQELNIEHTSLWRNVVMLGELLGLEPIHQQIVLLAALARRNHLLMETLENLRSTSLESFMKSLAIVLGVEEAELRDALQPSSPLRLARIAKIDWTDSLSGYTLDSPPRLIEALFSDASDLNALMSAFLEMASKPRLGVDDFPHYGEETRLLISYLRNAISSKASGVNVLIYGPPGTGKTEYVRLIASLISGQPYQIRSDDEDGRGISGTERLTFFQLAQCFLRSSDAVVLFDEIEDVFPNGDSLISTFRRSRTEVLGKLFINRLLEDNPVPAIWIANEVEHIDKAYLRRFDFSFEMKVPPRSVRKKILHSYLSHHTIPDRLIEHLSSHSDLSPAQIAKASKVVEIAGAEAGEAERAVQLVLRNSMLLLGQESQQQKISLAGAHYNLANLNADADVAHLIEQLKNQKAVDKGVSGALCFYGPPGTGKTALAHHIAEALSMPIAVRSASQILGSFVGQTEQNIAEMFREAALDRSVLLVDEADSFLASRAGARASWEVTAVNEMLIQMEQFQGLFICSTNLMDRLDEASLRRFSLKIYFDYLRPEQRWRLFVSHANESNSQATEVHRSTLNNLSNLTPGDFHTVRRQTDLLGVTLTADVLISRLVKECSSKPGNPNRNIGFIRSSSS